MSTHPTVSALGLGRMGSAIANCLAQAGVPLTVWNRSPAATFAFDGRAAIGMNVSAACAASDLLLLCLNNYSSGLEVLDDAAATTDLAGKTLVQLTSGSASDARTMHAWASMHGLDYLDAALLGYPSGVGSDAIMLFCAGDETVWDRHRDTLALLAGTARYVGDAIGGAATLDCALLEYYYGATLSMLHGAALCESEGVSLNEYFYLIKLLGALLTQTADESKQMINKSMYDQTQCTLDTHIAAMRHIQRMSHDNEVEPRVPDAIASAYRKAIAAGFHDDDIAALFEVLRKQ